MRSFAYRLLAFCLLFACHGAWASSHQPQPVPGWVVPRAVTVGPAPEATDDDVTYLLRMDQISLMGTRPQHYRRRVVRLNDTNAVRDWSTIDLTYYPDYQTLAIHRVRVYRGGTWHDRLASARIRDLQRGDGSDEGLVDNKRTVDIVLDDIRPGDVLDLAYTTTGDNPVFAGHYVSRMAVSADAPVKHREIRLLYPAARAVHAREYGPAMRHRRLSRDGRVEERWEADNLPAFSTDDDSPDWYEPSGWLDISDYADWNAVQRWAGALYMARPGAPGVQALVRRWRKAHPGDLAAQALAALHFVQDDIRYTGIEIDSGSYKPRAPRDVLRTRYGDCKDKVNLLVSLWRAQGLHAWPALVSTWRQSHVDGDLPGPLSFNHVIAHLDWRGSRWIDATQQLQGGDLADTAQARFGRALVLGDGSAGLTPIPDPLPKGILIDVSETMDLRASDGGLAHRGTLEVTTVYRGEEADVMRDTLSSTSRKDLSKHYLNYLNMYYDQVQSSAPLKVVDDRRANRLRVTERYLLTGLFSTSASSKDIEQGIWLNVLSGYLQQPKALHRTAPYALGRFRAVREHLVVHLDNGWRGFNAHTDVDDAWMSMHGQVMLGHDGMALEATYRTLRRDVPAKDMASYAKALRQARQGLYYTLSRSAR